MSLSARKPLIFVFVLGAFALAALMVYFFGGRESLSRHETFLVYFDDTVHGLVPGSQVKFKGVPIGSVQSIRLDYRQPGGDRRVPVLIQLNVDRLQHQLGVLEDLSDPAVLAAQVHRGLRAEMQVEHYVTGEMSVELEYHSPVPAFVPVTTPPGLSAYPVMPSVPSEDVANFQKAQDIISWLPTYDFKGEIEKVGDKIDSATTMVSVIPYAEYNQHIRQALGPLVNFNFPSWQRNFDNFFSRLDNYQGAIGDANRLFYSESQDFVAMNGQARSQLQQWDANLAALRAALQPTDPSLAHLTHNFEQLSGDMKRLTDKLNAFEQQPSLLDKVAP